MITKNKNPADLRSARWFAPDDLRAFGHRSRAMQMGYAPEEWKGRPVIAILNTWSDAQPCHMHFKSRVDDVKRGILMAGGFPMELPALSLSESFLKPTTMLYRNMLAMDAEELLRGHPVDGVVLMGGCDKTTPGLLLGATSMGLPAIYLPAGPMLRGNWKGKTLGSGSDAWKYWDERRAGKISDKDWVDVEAGIARSYGTCMTMGTASTMTAIAESIGMTLPGASSIPAADAGHIRMSSESGRRIVEDPDPKGIRECDHRGDGDGLFDQCDHPSDRAGTSRRPGHRPRRFRKGQPQGTRDCQCAAKRRHLSDGRLFLCRRLARPDEPHQGASASRCDDGHRPDARRKYRARRSL
jgi:dihydroxyacid dehydratase/phosphogluconate dehydratase